MIKAFFFYLLCATTIFVHFTMALTGNWPMQNKIFFVFTTLSIWIALFIEPDKIYEWLLKRDIKKSLRK